MANRRRAVVVGVSVFVLLCAGAFATMYVTWRSHIEQTEKGPFPSVPPPGFGPGEVLQLPKIAAHVERDGVVVTLGNDTADRAVVIDPGTDRLIIEYESVPGEAPARIVREIPLNAPRTLAPGETLEPVFVSLGGHREAISVWFEKRDRHGVYSNGMTIP